MCLIYFNYISKRDHFISLIPNIHIVDLPYKLNKFSSKMQKTVAGIGLLRQCTFYKFENVYRINQPFAAITEKQLSAKKSVTMTPSAQTQSSLPITIYIYIYIIYCNRNYIL